MSTTYYVRLNECKCCGSAVEYAVAHTAAGWLPAFYSYPGLSSVEEWSRRVEQEGVPVTDEYGHTYTWAEFIECLTPVRTDLRSHVDAFSGSGQMVNGWQMLDSEQGYGERQVIAPRAAGEQS